MTDGPDDPANRRRGRLRPPPPTGDRVVPLEALGDLVHDGHVVGIGGTWLSARPMAAVRQLVRAKRRDLTVVSLTGSLDVDLLVGCGVARRIVFCFVSLGPFGLAPRFRNAAEQSEIELDEHSGHGLTVALEAASRGMDFHPFHGPVGTTLEDRYPSIPSPSTGAPVQIAPALPLDVAIVHAHAATRDGHALLAASVGVDVATARAADQVVVTTERLVDRLPDSGSRYLASGEVHAVIEVPWGAHPLAHVPDYGIDWRALLDYAEAAATREGFEDWVEDHVRVPEEERLGRLDAATRSTLQLVGRGGRGPRDGDDASPRPGPGPEGSDTKDGAIDVHERIIVELAALVHDGDVAVLGSYSPIAYAAALLAQRTHAPHLDFIAHGYAGSRVGWLGLLGLEGRAVRSGYGPLRYEELVGALRFRGLLAFEPVRPVQIDGQGAMNLRILDRDDTKVRLPGTAGAAEVLEMHRRPVGYLTDHSPRTCVGTVDDASLRIHPPHQQRDPFILVTDLAVMTFGSHGWEVRSRHPGVTAEELISATGFPVAGAHTAPESEDPDPAILRLLRQEIDPLGLARIELVSGSDRRRLLRELLAAEERLLANGGPEGANG